MIRMLVEAKQDKSFYLFYKVPRAVNYRRLEHGVDSGVIGHKVSSCGAVQIRCDVGVSPHAVQRSVKDGAVGHCAHRHVLTALV